MPLYALNSVPYVIFKRTQICHMLNIVIGTRLAQCFVIVVFKLKVWSHCYE